MKTQAQNKLTFKKNEIVELNNSQMNKIQGGTSPNEGIISVVRTGTGSGSSPICIDELINN